MAAYLPVERAYMCVCVRVCNSNLECTAAET